jgi:hypothetical protein
MFNWLRKKKVNPLQRDVDVAADAIVLAVEIELGDPGFHNYAKKEEALIIAANRLLPGKRHFLRRNPTKSASIGEQLEARQ